MLLGEVEIIERSSEISDANSLKVSSSVGITNPGLNQEGLKSPLALSSPPVAGVEGPSPCTSKGKISLGVTSGTKGLINSAEGEGGDFRRRWPGRSCSSSTIWLASLGGSRIRALRGPEGADLGVLTRCSPPLGHRGVTP